jgi:hypothetical protein
MIDRLAYITIQLTRNLEGLSQQDTLCQETQQKAEESFVASYGKSGQGSESQAMNFQGEAFRFRRSNSAL